MKTKPNSKRKSEPTFLHIDLGNQSIVNWLKENKYIIHSELVRYAELLVKNDLEYIEAILLSNFSDNVIMIVQKDSMEITLKKAMDYFLSIEEYELCGKIRDLNILIQKSKKNEERDIKNSKSNQRKSEVH